MAERVDLRALIDGEPATGLPLDDRGLAYGDGLFETVLVHGNQCVWLAQHLRRLRRDAERLGIAPPADALWEDDARRLLSGPPLSNSTAAAGSVLKLILTRGGGARGYHPATAVPARRISLRLAAPSGMELLRASGIAARWCRIRLGTQPALAGMKHLNRLEQVLARAEWDAPDVFEGLLLDTAGNVVCATAANLFVVNAGRLLTPTLEGCGIAGVCRDWVLGQVPVLEQALSPAQLLNADELFVCSSVRGILPVVALGDRRWPIGPITRSLMIKLADLHPAFAAQTDQ